MHARSRRTDGKTDRQTDEHHSNSVTIRSINASRAKRSTNVILVPIPFLLRVMGDLISKPLPLLRPLTHWGFCCQTFWAISPNGNPQRKFLAPPLTEKASNATGLTGYNDGATQAPQMSLSPSSIVKHTGHWLRVSR